MTERDARHGKRGDQVATDRQTDRQTSTKDCALRRAAPRSDALNGGDAAILWAEFSPYPAEAGIAGRRYKQLAPTYADPWALLMALCEAAFEGHHAAGSLNGEYLRTRAARIRETVHEEEKVHERIPAAKPRGMRSLADILGAA